MILICLRLLSISRPAVKSSHKKVKSWYLYMMVTQNMMRTHERNKSIRRKQILFVTDLDLIKCLKQLE